MKSIKRYIVLLCVFTVVILIVGYGKLLRLEKSYSSVFRAMKPTIAKLETGVTFMKPLIAAENLGAVEKNAPEVDVTSLIDNGKSASLMEFPHEIN